MMINNTQQYSTTDKLELNLRILAHCCLSDCSETDADGAKNGVEVKPATRTSQKA